MHGLIERQREAIAGLCRRYRVRRLDVFGSGALRDELAAVLGRRIDLVMAGSVSSPYIKAEVERTREPVYAA